MNCLTKLLNSPRIQFTLILNEFVWSLHFKSLLGTCVSAEFINLSYKAEFTVIWSQNHLIMPQNNLYITWKWKISYPHAPQSSALSPQVTSSIQNLLLRNNWQWHHCFKEVSSDQGPRKNWNLGPNRTRNREKFENLGPVRIHLGNRRPLAWTET